MYNGHNSGVAIAQTLLSLAKLTTQNHIEPLAIRVERFVKVIRGNFVSDTFACNFQWPKCGSQRSTSLECTFFFFFFKSCHISLNEARSKQHCVHLLSTRWFINRNSQTDFQNLLAWQFSPNRVQWPQFAHVYLPLATNQPSKLFVSLLQTTLIYLADDYLQAATTHTQTSFKLHHLSVCVYFKIRVCALNGREYLNRQTDKQTNG